MPLLLWAAVSTSIAVAPYRPRSITSEGSKPPVSLLRRNHLDTSLLATSFRSNQFSIWRVRSSPLLAAVTHLTLRSWLLYLSGVSMAMKAPTISSSIFRSGWLIMNE